ncbi:MAG: hypothetical protein ACR2O4_02375 [Hyphomicrobiaceae bacterium]
MFWPPPASGFVKLSVVDARGRTDRVTVRLRRSPKGGDSQ